MGAKSFRERLWAAAPALFLSGALGGFAVWMRHMSTLDVIDPLFLALLLGVVARSFLGNRWQMEAGGRLAVAIFIPPGIVLYGLRNARVTQFSEVSPRLLILVVLVLVAYFLTVYLLGAWLHQKRELTCLIATGSAICGASAIAITSPAVDAHPDDVSISLLSVSVVAFGGLFVVLPFLGILLDMTGPFYAILAGAVMQFTGFVRAAVDYMPALRDSGANVFDLALSVKAMRYFGLLLTIPLSGSLCRGRFYLPPALWLFALAALSGSLIDAYSPQFFGQYIHPVVKPLYLVLWAVAMAAIGLLADIRQLLSDDGVKALVMALGGFLVALWVFFLGAAFLLPQG